MEKITEIPSKEAIASKDAELLTNSDGKKYLYEKDSHFYGGDYLDEPPAEIHIDSSEDKKD